MKLPCGFVLAVISVTICGARTSFAQANTGTQPATVWYSEQFIVHSKVVGRDFLIQVARPVKPQTSKVPAIYLLDGTSLFGEVADMVVEYGDFGDAAPAYVVGIGYPNADLGQWLSLRNHDLVHVHIPDSFPGTEGTGDGALFQKFLLAELRPLIASRYPVDDGKAILASHSFGGLFAVHVLINDPGAFSGYLACSPSLWAEPQLLQKASAFHSPNPLRVFVGVGSREEDQHKELRMIGDARDFTNSLKNHDSASVSFAEFEGQTHGTVIAECLSHGIQFLLPAPSSLAHQAEVRTRGGH